MFIMWIGSVYHRSFFFFDWFSCAQTFPTCLFLNQGLLYYTATVSTYLGLIYVCYFTRLAHDANWAPFLVLIPTSISSHSIGLGTIHDS